MQAAQATLFGPDGLFQMGPVTVRHGPTYPRTFLKGPKTLPEFYNMFIDRFAELDFLVFEEERYTFKQVGEMANALSYTLSAHMNIQVGDRVAVSMRNYPEWCIAYMAATHMGAVIVPLNSLWKDSEYAYGLKDSGTKVLVCDEERYHMAKGACDDLRVKIILARHSGTEPPAGTMSFNAALSLGAGKSAPSAQDLHPDDICGIMYTSGTTGNPKGVMHTHRGVSQQMCMIRVGEEMPREVARLMNAPAQKQVQPCMILPVPLFHVTGSHHVFLASFVWGYKIVMMYKWDPLTALRLIEKEKATAWTGVPTMIQDMMEHPDFSKYDTSTLKSVTGGGGPTPKAQVAKSASKFKGSAPGQGYGLTETNGAVCFNGGDDYINRPTSIGLPFPIVEFQIRDVDTRKLLPPGQRGELWIRSPLNMRGYYNKPDKTAEVLDAEGWFASGDVAMLDEEGYAYIVDRAKDLIIRGGENISCAEVEGAFYETGKVLECAAFGIPHERLGEVVGLMVVPSSGVPTFTATELRGLVQGKIAAFKMPNVEHIFITNERLPRGATEKIQKREIRDRVAQQLNRTRSKL